MSATPLTTIQEIIERSLFERIRQEVVDKGYLPDISDTATYPDTTVGWDLWEANIRAIAINMGFAIEVFSVGSSESKGVKKVPRIVIDTGNFLPGALGGDPRRFFEDQGEYYTALVTPPQTVDFYINFHLISETVAQARILNAILALAIPRRSYIPWYNNNEQTFFARFLNYYNTSNVGEGLIEHVYAYEVPDAWDREDTEVDSALYEDSTIPKISQITLNPNVQKYMDGSWGYDSSPLIVNSGD